MKLRRYCTACDKPSIHTHIGPVVCPHCGHRWSIRWKKGEQPQALAELRDSGSPPQRSHERDLDRAAQRYRLTASQRAAMDAIFKAMSREPPPGEPALTVDYHITREHGDNVITVRATCQYAGEPLDRWHFHITPRGHIDVLGCPVRYRRLGGTVAFGLRFAPHLAL